LDRAVLFFSEARRGIEAQGDTDISPPAFISDLETLLRAGADTVEQIEKFIDQLADGVDTHNTPTELGGRKCRLIWMSKSQRVSQWNYELRESISDICHLLLAHNMLV